MDAAALDFRGARRFASPRRARRARALAAPLAALALACATSSCTLWRDYRTYRHLLAHEREHAAVEIVRYDLCAKLDVEQRSAHVVAGITLRNSGDDALEKVRFLLSPDLALAPPRCGDAELAYEVRVERLGGLAATAVEIEGFPAVAPGAEIELVLEYDVRSPAQALQMRIEPDHGYLLLEGLWVPMLRTPLSMTGMDRAPATLEIALPEPLVPVSIAELELVSSDGTTGTWRGTSSFPFAPFFVYGAYTSAEKDGARVYALDPASDPRASDFLLSALAELRAHYEQAFGPVDLPVAKVAAVRRFGGSWGAPCCILLDEGSWPSEPRQEPSAFQLLAHELAHTWWGTTVSMFGRGGYLHEGLANWCAADALGARAGSGAKERALEAWMLRYAAGEAPLRCGLAEVSFLEPERYERGAYLVAAHFYCALEERLGRERFVALLRRFAEEHAFQAADFDDLRALLQREHESECRDLFEDWVDSARGSDALYARARALLDERMARWRAREPAPRAELVARVESVLAEACERAASADFASLAAAERGARGAELFGELNALPELQVTVIDARAELVYHAGGMTGSVRGHLDVRGRPVYVAIADDPAPAGSLANFDFLLPDLSAGRENSVAWRKLGELAIVVEGHEWRAIDAVPAP